MNEKVTTGDRFEAAYYLAHACELEAVTFRNEHGKEWAYFTFRAERLLTSLSEAYRTGQGVADIYKLKHALRKLNFYLTEARQLESARQNGGRATGGAQ